MQTAKSLKDGDRFTFPKSLCLPLYIYYIVMCRTLTVNSLTLFPGLGNSSQSFTVRYTSGYRELVDSLRGLVGLPACLLACLCQGLVIYPGLSSNSQSSCPSLLILKYGTGACLKTSCKFPFKLMVAFIPALCRFHH